MSVQSTMQNTLKAGLLVAAAGSALPAGAAPRIVGPATRECRDTLIVANAAFYSKAFRLDEAVTLPRGAPVQIVAQRLPGDISGGDGMTADATVFKTGSSSDDSDFRKLYWQISPTAGARWVITDSPAGWRGDRCGLYAVDPSEPEAGFAPASDKRDPRELATESLIPPLMLRETRGKAVWAVSLEGWDVSETWDVYATGKDGAKERCTIAFGPKVKTAFDLLPAPVRALAVDLDGTMGDGHGEGTLQPTAMLRDDVSQAWTDTALRPWAVTAKPYHSRRDADLGLRRWSYGAPSFRALYLRIQAEYPAAVDALASLYAERFGKTPEEARKLATRNLDIAYRSHFCFSQSFIHPKPPAKAKT